MQKVANIKKKNFAQFSHSCKKLLQQSVLIKNHRYDSGFYEQAYSNGYGQSGSTD